MSWDYILHERTPERRTRYTFNQLLDQYNALYKTEFREMGPGGVVNPNGQSCFIKTLDGLCSTMIVHSMATPSESYVHWQPLFEFLANKGLYSQIMVTNIVGERSDAWEQLGYRLMSSVYNKRTGNKVAILVKDI